MGMVDEQCDRSAVSRSRLGIGRQRGRVLVGVSGGDSVDVVIELDEEKRLVLHVREEVVVADEVKDAWPSQLEKVWQRLPGLAVEHEPVLRRSDGMIGSTGSEKTCSSATLSMRIFESGLRWIWSWIARMTAATS